LGAFPSFRLFSCCPQGQTPSSFEDRQYAGPRFGDFYYWAIAFFGQCFENGKRRPNFVATFSMENYVLILTKMSLATFWLIFSQTHLVTLVGPHFLLAVMKEGFIGLLRSVLKVNQFFVTNWTGYIKLILAYESRYKDARTK
jgi:hypothetical protein